MLEYRGRFWDPSNPLDRFLWWLVYWCTDSATQDPYADRLGVTVDVLRHNLETLHNAFAANCSTMECLRDTIFERDGTEEHAAFVHRPDAPYLPLILAFPGEMECDARRKEQSNG